MFGIDKKKEEVIKVENHSFYLDRHARTLQQVDDPRKIIKLDALKVDAAQGGMPVLWDRLTGMPYEGFMPLHGQPLHTIRLVLPIKLLERERVLDAKQQADRGKSARQARFKR